MRGIIFLIDGVFGIMQALLGIRLLLKFFGASAQAPVVAWLYANTEPLLSPFSGAFPSSVVEKRFVIEFTTLFAIVAYSLIRYFVVQLIALTDDQAVIRRRRNLE